MSKLRKWLPDILFVLLLLATRSSLADHYYVPSGSMEYTLLPGDHVFVNKAAYGFEIPFLDVELFSTGKPNPGDVAIFDSPYDGTRLIKRIVAVGGDQVELRSGHLYLNGEELVCATDTSEECFSAHIAQLNLLNGPGPDIDTFVVPEGKVLAIGDNRGNSFDSRFWGLVDESELYGKAISVFYRKHQGVMWQLL